MNDWNRKKRKRKWYNGNGFTAKQLMCLGIAVAVFFGVIGIVVEVVNGEKSSADMRTIDDSINKNSLSTREILREMVQEVYSPPSASAAPSSIFEVSDEAERWELAKRQRVDEFLGVIAAYKGERQELLQFLVDEHQRLSRECEEIPSSHLGGGAYGCGLEEAALSRRRVISVIETVLRESGVPQKEYAYANPS